MKKIKGISLWQDAWKRLKKNRMAIFGGTVVLLFILIALLADIIAPFSYQEIDLPNQYKPPSARHILSASTLCHSRQPC